MLHAVYDLSSEPYFEDDWDGACRLVFGDLLNMNLQERVALIMAFSRSMAERWAKYANILDMDPWEGISMPNEISSDPATPCPPELRRDSRASTTFKAARRDSTDSMLELDLQATMVPSSSASSLASSTSQGTRIAARLRSSSPQVAKTS
jgi:hypothetical protein